MAALIEETARLRLREWDDGDELRFYGAMNTPAVMRWLGGVQSAAEWNAGYHRIRAYQRDFGFTFWIVERREDGELLGFCGLMQQTASDGVEAVLTPGRPSSASLARSPRAICSATLSRPSSLPA